MASPSITDEPVSWIFSKLRGLLNADPVPGTRTLSVVTAMAMTSLPLGLLNYVNRFQVAGPGPLYRIAAASVVVALVASVVLGRRWAPHVAGLMVGAFGYGFFSMSWLERSSTVLLFGTWIVLSFLGGVSLIWLLGNARWAIVVATIVTTASAAGLFGGAALAQSDSQEFALNRDVPESLAFVDVPEVRPNVYLFILDGFARPDITAEQFDEHDVAFDISEQILALEALGFHQDELGTANYTRTILSVPSTLNATYHHVPEEPATAEEVWEQGRQALAGNNVLANSLRNIGYEYWHASPAIWEFAACQIEVADRCIGDPGVGFETRNAVWSETPLRNSRGLDLGRATDPTTVVDDILAARESSPSSEPYFLFSHILSPHQPYRFDADCSLRDSNEGMSLRLGHAPQFRPLYADAANCLASQLETSMTALLEADPSAIIFLQADHGSAFEVDFVDHTWQDQMVRERMGIFRMTLLPDSCRSDSAAAQSLINTAPLIIGCLTSQEPDLVEPRVLLVDFTDQVEVQDAGLPLIEQR